MKKKSLAKRIKSWFFEKFLRRYLVSVDKMFIELFIKYDAKAPVKTYESQAEIAYKRIMRMLNSDKYRDYFYKVVQYDRHVAESLIKPYGNTWKDKVFAFIAEKYIRYFKRDLYKSIQQFKRIRDGIITLNSKIDEYMANTSTDERLERASTLGIIDDKRAEAQKRLHNIHAIRVNAIHELNKVGL